MTLVKSEIQEIFSLWNNGMLGKDIAVLFEVAPSKISKIVNSESQLVPFTIYCPYGHENKSPKCFYIDYKLYITCNTCKCGFDKKLCYEE